MKRIIDGILYDTGTAELLYHDKAKNTKYYRTPVQHLFFIYYSRGEFSPVDETFMKNFLGEYDIAKYIQIFGEPQEG